MIDNHGLMRGIAYALPVSLLLFCAPLLALIGEALR